MKNKIEYIVDDAFYRQLHKVSITGGRACKKAERVYAIIGKFNKGEDPFRGVPITNHGETRIPHCIKYDLNDGYRLVTIQNDNYCELAYFGTHDKTDNWIEKNKGRRLIKDKNNQYSTVCKSNDISCPAQRISKKPVITSGKILDSFMDTKLEKFLDELPGSIVRNLSKLEFSCSDNDILDILTINDCKLKELAYDVMIHLRGADFDGANNRLDLHWGTASSISDMSPEEITNIQNGQNVKKFKIDDIDWLQKYVRNASYQDWMLFMHPNQEEVVFTDYNGPTKLSGVSGSGKTCVIIMRAKYLAEKKPQLPILIVTLNKSLSQLISGLMDAACPDKEVRNRIQCKSLFALCQELLGEFEPQSNKLHNDITWKTNEHIDEVWREFYRCEVNNNSADIFLPIHKSLNQQGINAEEYVRQELDWVRSAVSHRDEYLNIERRGRAIPLNKNQRSIILNGLSLWEEKMKFVGITDSMGLVVDLIEYFTQLRPKYSSILVDEVQDFGTLDLQIVRKLVEPGKNDLFLSGDMAQHILPKHQNFKAAGILVPGARSKTLKRNYRNSRQILKAAYEVFIQNLNSEVLTDSDLELLDPTYANFSTPKPQILQASSLEEEMAYAIFTAEAHLSSHINHKICIAIAGFSHYEVTRIAKQVGRKSLDGESGLITDNLFLSDLDQTKGYEFDVMYILNCSKNILPNPETPPDEYYRDACRFYVAMTRAKQELYLSYAGNPSIWLTNEKCAQFFDEAIWEEIFEGNSLDSSKKEFKEILSTVMDISRTDVLELTGKQFIRSSYAKGLSTELQEKLITLITGKAVRMQNYSTQWSNIANAYRDVKNEPRAKAMFGEKVWREFIDCIEKIVMR